MGIFENLLKGYNPEDDEELGIPRMPASVPAPAAAPAQSVPDVKQYIAKKFNLGDFSDENRQKLVDENNEYDVEGNSSAALASLAAAFQGKDSMAAMGAQKDRINKGKLEQLNEFDKGRAGKIQSYDLDRKFTADSKSDDLSAREMDINSEESKLAQSLAKKMAPGMDFSKMSAAQINDRLPSLTKIYDIEQKKIDRQLAREATAATKSAKSAELSAQQSKQAGLYNSGMLAEDQYTKAIGDRKSYDPTSYQLIDNNSWAPNWLKDKDAVTAENAKSAWVEAFLRDASGAAIPPSERGAYAKDFFPQEGDSDDDVTNKAMLRKQKMDNARLAAGGDKLERAEKKAGVQTKQPGGGFPRQVRKGSEVATVSNDNELKEATAEGWK